MVLLEVCIDSVESAHAAYTAGAHRVEVCSALLEGGLTPSIGLLTILRRQLPSLPLYVLIRPRPGDFCYTTTECEVMCEDIAAAKQVGASGIVVGCLTPDGRVDAQQLRAFVAQARGMQVTFHRAVDMSADVLQAVRDVCSVKGVQRILTSGGAATALQGAERIAAMVRTAAMFSDNVTMAQSDTWCDRVVTAAATGCGSATRAQSDTNSDPCRMVRTSFADCDSVTASSQSDTCSDRVVIVAGGGITEHNIAEVVRRSGVTEVHGSARETRDSVMVYRNTACFMGAERVHSDRTEFTVAVATERRVGAFLSALRENHSRRQG